MGAQAYQRPAPALSGAKIEVIAPASPFDREAFDRGVARLRARGFDMRFDDGLFAKDGYFAGSDARRIAELERALEGDAQVVVCARGGYGATRLLPALSPDRIAASPKLFVGFSDATALHALFARAGVQSLHGPMIASLGRAAVPAVDRFVRAIRGEPTRTFDALAAIRPGVAEGPLAGGNLAVLCAMVGTPYFPPIDGALLFIEDVTERPYRVDRMLTQLAHAGVFTRVAGVVVGAFTSCPPGSDGVTVERVIAERLGDLGCPVATGLPCGHIDDNHELLLGAPYRLDASAGKLSLL